MSYKTYTGKSYKNVHDALIGVGFTQTQVDAMKTDAQKKANLNLINYYLGKNKEVSLTATSHYNILPTGQLQITTSATQSQLAQWIGSGPARIVQVIGGVGTVLLAPEIAGIGLGGGAAGGAAAATGTAEGAAAGTAAKEGAAPSTAAKGAAGGAAGGTATNAAKNAAKSAATTAAEKAAGVAGTAGLIALITSVGFWMRVGEVILGSVLLLLGLRAMTTGETGLPNIPKVA